MDFPRFQDLPVELRLRIWHLAVTPRLVHYPRRVDLYGISSRGRTKSLMRYHQTYPSLLQANRESRYIMSSTYPSRFELSDSRVHLYGVPFNADLDTLLVDVNWAYDLAQRSSEDLKHVKFIAVRGEYYPDLNPRRNLALLFRPLAALFSSCPLAEKAYYCLPDFPSQHLVKEKSTSITSSNRVGDLSSQSRSLPAQDNAFDEVYVTRVRRDLHQAWDYWKSMNPTRFAAYKSEEEREMEYLAGVKRWNDCARVVCLSDLQSERHILGAHEFIFEPLSVPDFDFIDKAGLSEAVEGDVNETVDRVVDKFMGGVIGEVS